MKEANVFVDFWAPYGVLNVTFRLPQVRQLLFETTWESFSLPSCTENKYPPVM